MDIIIFLKFQNQKSQGELEDKMDIEEPHKLKCIYCNRPIYKENLAGITFKGVVCGNISCLMELAREIKEKQK